MDAFDFIKWKNLLSWIPMCKWKGKPQIEENICKIFISEKYIYLTKNMEELLQVSDRKPIRQNGRMIEEDM